MFIAVIGCGHGEIDKIYEVIANIEEKRNIKVDLVLCCGDFQTVRNMTDLRCMACPIKYQHMHDFYRYYSGEKKAPILTLFIGGNHEASNFLQELPYGGWVAPNIYFMGNSGVVKFGHLRIAGISGIFKGRDYLNGRFEYPPYSQDTMRSVYHYRNLDTFRMKQMKKHVDIILSHDWPKGIHKFGDTRELLRQKPFFRNEIENDDLGSRPLFELLIALEPSYWFSAHLHVKFQAVVLHDHGRGEGICSTSSPENPNVETLSKMTKFLALDKVLPRRQFLQIVEIPNTTENEGKLEFSYDEEWLAILKSTDHLISTKQRTCFMPGPGPGSNSNRSNFTPTEEELGEITAAFHGNFVVPQNFVQTAPPHIPGEKPGRAFHIMNPQCKEFCDKLEITDPISQLVSDSQDVLCRSSGHEQSFEFNSSYSSMPQTPLNPDEISLEDSDEDIQTNNKKNEFKSTPSTSAPLNPPRRKLILPQPKSSTSVEESASGDSKDELNLLSSVFNTTSSSSTTENLQQLNESGQGHFFSIDKVGEPEPDFKKRRNSQFYKFDE